MHLIGEFVQGGGGKQITHIKNQDIFHSGDAQQEQKLTGLSELSVEGMAVCAPPPPSMVAMKDAES